MSGVSKSEIIFSNSRENQFPLVHHGLNSLDHIVENDQYLPLYRKYFIIFNIINSLVDQTDSTVLRPLQILVSTGVGPQLTQFQGCSSWY